MPAAANGANGTDGELVVIDGDIAYNFWQFNRTSNTTATASSYGSDNVVTGDGWGSKAPFLSAGTTAVGASELGGLLVKAQTDTGTIDHALQLVVDSSLAMPGAVGNAISSDGGSSTGIVKEGELLGISPNTPMPSGLSALGQEVFKAMQQYGAYVVDVAGGVTNIRAQANAYDNATMTALWHDMANITPLLQAVNPGSGSSSGGSGSGGVTTPPVTTPPVTTPPVTTPPVTTPPVTTPTDTTAPKLQWVAANGNGVTNGTGTVGVGGTVRLSLNFSEAVNVTGTPTLALNSNGTAKYVSGSGTNTLTFDYTVGAGQSAADLAITGFNLGGVKDAAGNAVNISGAPTQPAGTLAIIASGSTTNPTAPSSIAPVLTVADPTLSVSPGGTVSLGIGVSVPHAGDNVTVNIAGLPRYETITDNLDHKTFSGSSITLTAAQVNSGLTLASNYKGHGHPTATLTATATDNTGTPVTSAAQSIVVNDPPATTAPGTGTGTGSSGGVTPPVVTAPPGTGASGGATPPVVTSPPGTGASGGATPPVVTSPPTSGGSTETSGCGSSSHGGWPGQWGHGHHTLAGAPSGFGNHTTLGYTANTDSAGGNSTAADGMLASKTALFNQYMASSFTNPAPAAGSPHQHQAWANISQTLARPHG
jgi:hypothetical protein